MKKRANYLRIRMEDVLIPQTNVLALMKIAIDRGYQYDGEKDAGIVIRRMFRDIVADEINLELKDEKE